MKGYNGERHSVRTAMSTTAYVPGGHKTDLTSVQALYLVIRPLMARNEPTYSSRSLPQSMLNTAKLKNSKYFQVIILPGEKTLSLKKVRYSGKAHGHYLFHEGSINMRKHANNYSTLNLKL